MATLRSPTPPTPCPPRRAAAVAAPPESAPVGEELEGLTAEQAAELGVAATDVEKPEFARKSYHQMYREVRAPLGCAGWR